MRKPIIAGNWKMNMTVAGALELIAGLKQALPEPGAAEVVICPTFTALDAAGKAVKGTHIDLGAQNMHWEASGAYTGEIAVDMLKELGCNYVILGHSERRQYFGETDEGVNKKAKAALAAGLHPIICVGETLEQREAGETERIVSEQVRGSLADLGQDGWVSTIIAYEPVWAIGTGLTASPEQAQAVHAFIREILTDMADESVAEAVRIQYGGSMKPGNAAELLGQQDIDGGLIGGAALKADSFAAIIQAAG